MMNGYDWKMEDFIAGKCTLEQVEQSKALFVLEQPPEQSPPPPRPVRKGSRREVRQAVDTFLTNGAPGLLELVAQTADGIPKVNADGVPIRDHHGSVVYLVKPNPQAAAKLISDVLDFATPRLQRTELNATIDHREGLPLEQLSSAELQRRLLEQFGLMEEGEVIDVTPEPVPVDELPDWLKSTK